MPARRPIVPVQAAIALGSNLPSPWGDPIATLERALVELDQAPGVRVRAAAEPIRTTPVGPIDQPDFANSAAILDTTLSPSELLATLLEIERRAGRDRESTPRWGPRTLDLDLLLYADATSQGPDLTLPHPRLHERAFVLEPLSRIAPDWRPPGQARTIRELLRALSPSA